MKINQSDRLKEEKRLVKTGKMISQDLTQKIRYLISEHRIEEALASLRENVSSPITFHDEILILQSRLSNLEKENRLGIVDYNTLTIHRNQIVYSLINLVDKLSGNKTRGKETLSHRDLFLNTDSRKNIFLDFLNPDFRKTLGVFDNLRTSKQHIKYLKKTLNSAIFLCGDYTILPPTFVLECPYTLNVCKWGRKYFEADLIRLPLRENSFAVFFEKKLSEYNNVKDSYSQMFDSQGKDALRFLFDVSFSQIYRNAKVGSNLVKMWENNPDSNLYWKGIIDKYPMKTIEIIRDIPNNLLLEDQAITGHHILQKIDVEKFNVAKYDIQNMILFAYGDIYIKEYGLRIVSNLPFSRDSFGHNQNDKQYDYFILKSVLSPIGLDLVVLDLQPIDMISLRNSIGYLKFISLYSKITKSISNSQQIKTLTAHAFNYAKKSDLFYKEQMNKKTVDLPEKISTILSSFADALAELI